MSTMKPIAVKVMLVNSILSLSNNVFKAKANLYEPCSVQKWINAFAKKYRLMTVRAFHASRHGPTFTLSLNCSHAME